MTPNLSVLIKDLTRFIWSNPKYPDSSLVGEVDGQLNRAMKTISGTLVATPLRLLMLWSLVTSEIHYQDALFRGFNKITKIQCWSTQGQKITFMLFWDTYDSRLKLIRLHDGTSLTRQTGFYVEYLLITYINNYCT